MLQIHQSYKSQMTLISRAERQYKIERGGRSSVFSIHLWPVFWVTTPFPYTYTFSQCLLSLLHLTFICWSLCIIWSLLNPPPLQCYYKKNVLFLDTIEWEVRKPQGPLMLHLKLKVSQKQSVVLLLLLLLLLLLSLSLLYLTFRPHSLKIMLRLAYIKD